MIWVVAGKQMMSLTTDVGDGEHHGWTDLVLEAGVVLFYVLATLVRQYFPELNKRQVGNKIDRGSWRWRNKWKRVGVGHAGLIHKGVSEPGTRNKGSASKRGFSIQLVEYELVDGIIENAI